MPVFVLIILFVVISDVALFGALLLLAAYSRANRPPHVGRGRLADDGPKPNFVSSTSSAPDRSVPPLRFDDNPDEAWHRLQEVLSQLPKTEVISSDSHYLYAQCRTPLFGFVDDLELLLNRDEKFIHVRSGSRVGRSDFGANHKRIDNLRAAFESPPGTRSDD
tara:strand:- start:297 stop:785 length:489 start_codon:yes stop_codon:yes gene_type:complete